MTTTPADLLRAALYYASRGWRVFPVTPRQKAPPLVKWQTEASADEATVRRWWGEYPAANIGLATGAGSGLLALDIDGTHGGEESLMALLNGHDALPHTPESLTGSGRHILFGWPGCDVRNSAGLLAPGLDIRGEGGYIVAPPSIHPSGRSYTWELSSKPSRTPLAAPPDWLLARLSEKLTPARTNGKEPPDDSNGQPIISGQRNSALTSLAGTMRRRGFTLDAILAALLAENRDRCSPPLAEAEVHQVAKNVARYAVRPAEDITARGPTPPREMTDAFHSAEMFVHLLCNLDGRTIPTHIGPLDRSLGGLERQTLTVLAGRPGMGKTSLAWQIARNVAAGRKRTLFFSLEMSIASLWARAACGVLALRWRDVRNGDATVQQLEQLVNTARGLAQRYGEFLLLDDGTCSTSTVWQAVEKYNPDLVVIDHLRLMKNPGENEVQRLGQITQQLKDLAKAANCAVLSLAQLNRGVERQDNKRPGLADLRDSGQIEENADLVLMMYRDDYYNPRTGQPVPVETEVLVRKFRDDVNSQIIRLMFDPSRQWFDAKAAPTTIPHGKNGRNGSVSNLLPELALERMTI